jgi:hypothetical protein
VRKPILLRGPWKGAAPGLEPSQLSPDTFSDAVNSSFYAGKAKQLPAVRVLASLPDEVRPGLLSVFVVRPKDGMDKMLYVCQDRLYLGDALRGRVREVTPRDSSGRSQWIARSRHDVTFLQVSTDVDEWIVLLSRRMRFFVRMLIAGGVRFEVFKPTDFELRGGKVATVFADRLVFGNLMFDVADLPHAVGWYGVLGPFDTDFRTAGYAALTEIPGPVTAMVPMRDMLVVFKPTGAYVVQRTSSVELPFAFRPRVQDVGCSSQWHVAPVARREGVVWYSEMTRRLFLWSGDAVQDITGPMEGVLQEMPTDVVLWANDDYLDLIWPNKRYRMSFAGGWWTEIDHGVEGDTVGIVPSVVLRTGLTIDELDGQKIDSLPGRIDDFGGPEVLEGQATITLNAVLVQDDAVMGYVRWRTAELRFEKPVTVTSFTARVRAPYGGVFTLRVSIDGGRSWTAYDTTEVGDLEGVARVPLHFVETSEQFTFEVSAFGSKIELVDMVIDVVATSGQEDVSPTQADSVQLGAYVVGGLN